MAFKYGDKIKAGTRVRCLYTGNHRHHKIGTVVSDGASPSIKWDDNDAQYCAWVSAEYFELYIPDDCS